MYTVTPTLERCSYNIMKSSSTEQLLRKRTRSNRFVLVIHGGAGAMTKSGSTPEQVEAYHAALRSALQAGFQVLQEGGEALDAAVAAVTVMEGNKSILTVILTNKTQIMSYSTLAKELFLT